jgi:hypothetical protein
MNMRFRLDIDNNYITYDIKRSHAAGTDFGEQ